MPHPSTRLASSFLFGGLLVGLSVCGAVACDDGPRCTAGESSACACPNGDDGAQVCADDGTFEECRCEGGGNDGGPSPEAEPSTDAGAEPEVSPEDPHAVLAAFSQRLGGLWEGPATQTVLGDFPIMIMDFRPVEDSWVFGRVDLDSGNNLRFLFDVEDIGGETQLVYRNGGYFQDQFRDSRTVVVEAQPENGYFRFCSAPRGCSYIDAVFNFTSADRLEFDATVNEETHVVWNATRRVENVVGATFPADDVITEGADFPAMPRAEVTATFPEPAAQVNLFVSLATEDCTVATLASCSFSRTYVQSIGPGETTATVPFEQLHAGTYQAVAVVDQDGTEGPSPGDSFSLLRTLDVPNDPDATATAQVQVFDF